MNDGIVAVGRPVHRHDLPEIPVHDGYLVENSVAECSGCGRLFVSRWGEWGVDWVPLRWWHRTARANLRAAGR